MTKGKWSVIKTLLCGASVITSIVISVIMISLGENPQTDALSRIGYVNRGLFFVWGVTTGLAVYLNLKILSKRLQFKSKIFDIALILGCSMSIVAVTVMGYSPANRAIHIISSGIFGVVCVACVLTLMIVKAIKKNKRTSVPYITAMALAGVIFIFTSAQVGWFTASTQVLLANVCLTAMFCSNFIERLGSYPAGCCEEPATLGAPQGTTEEQEIVEPVT